MIGIANFVKSGCIQVVVVNAYNYNRMRGAKYLFMDSNSFMGRNDGAGYESVIKMCDSIWKINGYGLLTEF
jgi:hypothetical protein